MLKEFNQSNEHYFDISHGLRQHAESTPPNLGTGFQLKQSLTAYRLRYGERYSATGTENPIEIESGVSIIYWATDAALPNNTDNDLTDYYVNSSVRLWFTQVPYISSVREDGIAYLYFIYRNTLAPTVMYYAISISATLMNGNVVDAGRYHGRPVLEGIVGIRVDPNAWNMPTFETTNGPVQSYTVALVQSSTPLFTSFSVISQPQTFVVDRKCEEYTPITLVWLESLGDYAAYTFNGDREYEPSRETSLFRRGQMPASNDPANWVEAIQKVDYRLRTTANTGKLDKDTFNWIRESLSSSVQVYVVSGNDLLAVNIIQVAANSLESDNILSLSVVFQATEATNTLTT
jgi:hypothetical protein